MHRVIREALDQNDRAIRRNLRCSIFYKLERDFELLERLLFTDERNVSGTMKRLDLGL